MTLLTTSEAGKKSMSTCIIQSSDLGEDLSQLRTGMYQGQSLLMILQPVVESLPAIVLELVLLGAHSQRVLTSAPSSGIITDCNDVCTESFI